MNSETWNNLRVLSSDLKGIINEFKSFLPDKNIPDSVEEFYNLYKNDWEMAIDNSRLDVINYLIEINEIDLNEALSYAISNGCYDVVKCLFKTKADVTFKNNTAIPHAVMGGYINIVDFLLYNVDGNGNKADPTTNIYFAIRTACEENKLEIVNLLDEYFRCKIQDNYPQETFEQITDRKNKLYQEIYEQAHQAKKLCTVKFQKHFNLIPIN